MKKTAASILCAALFIFGVLISSQPAFAVSESDLMVNTRWELSEENTTEYTSKENGSNRAFYLGKSKIGDVNVTATFSEVRGDDRYEGSSYLSPAGGNQSSYGAVGDMFYAVPTPENIPALGIYAQPGRRIIPPKTIWDKLNFNGRAEVGTVTFTFDRAVTDPVLDISGLGGYNAAGALYHDDDGSGPFRVGRGSFNSTDIELVTPGIVLKLDSAKSKNLIIDGNEIKVKERNTNTRSTVASPGYNVNYIMNDDGSYATYPNGELIYERGPNLVPAGTGSIILKGTFKTVSFKLYHMAVPYSAFPTETYGTDEIYFWNSSWGPEYGDGKNGLNVLNTESFLMANTEFSGLQNADLFRASLRLQKPSTIGDTVWLDKNDNGIQDEGEPRLDGVTVKLLDENGNPAKDYNGNFVADQTTANGGKYKFENLAAGKYYVQILPGENQLIAKKTQGDDPAKDSDVNVDTGKTDRIILEPNTDRTDIDAGVVITYKVTHEFISGTPNKELPQAVKDLTPEDQKGKKNGETVTPTPPGKTTVEVTDGTWTFVSYDRENDVINNGDRHFIGKWVFNEKQRDKGSVYVKYITEDGKVLEAESTVKKDAPAGEEYTTEKKKFDGYEFVKMADDSAKAKGKVEAGKDLHVTYVYRAKKKPDPPTPLPGNPGNTNVPKTGDSFNAPLYVTLLVVSVVLIAAIIIVRKKKNKK